MAFIYSKSTQVYVVSLRLGLYVHVTGLPLDIKIEIEH